MIGEGIPAKLNNIFSYHLYKCYKVRNVYLISDDQMMSLIKIFQKMFFNSQGKKIKAKHNMRMADKWVNE